MSVHPPHRRLSEPAYRGEFVSRYDQLRPKPPVELLEVVCSLASIQSPKLVVDLGAGTGLSTVAWADRAERVIGIEQNAEMLAHARQAANVDYRHATADDTELAEASADIVTCAQSFHWMNHDTTIPEIARLLRPGAVFAAYDYDWPPLTHWEIDAAFLAMIKASGVDASRPEKARHLDRLQASGQFRFVHEFLLHSLEPTDPERLSRLPLAFGPIARRMNEGASELDLGLDRYRALVEQHAADADTLIWSYRVRIGVR